MLCFTSFSLILEFYMLQSCQYLAMLTHILQLTYIFLFFFVIYISDDRFVSRTRTVIVEFNWYYCNIFTGMLVTSFYIIYLLTLFRVEFLGNFFHLFVIFSCINFSFSFGLFFFVVGFEPLDLAYIMHCPYQLR